jgi:hypothetical protein
MSKVSLGKVSEIIERGEKNSPLFMKEGEHLVKLLGKGTWGQKASQCILTDKGTIGAYQLIDQMRKDGILEDFLDEAEFVFETGEELFVTINAKAVVETRLPDEEEEEEEDEEEVVVVKKKTSTKK